jgi:hypothetical protein
MKTGVSINEIKKANIPPLNENCVLYNLNRLIGTEQKIKNFRVAKQKLYEIFSKKFGYDIIINFFNLQSM